jgi:hypothetical protein
MEQTDATYSGRRSGDPLDELDRSFSGSATTNPRSGAIRSLSRRETRVRAAGLRICEGRRLGMPNGLRPQTLCDIADSPIGLAAYLLDHDARSLELISRAFAGQPHGPHTRRRPRQYHALLVDEHGTFLGLSLLGAAAGAGGVRLFQCQRRLHPSCRERAFLTSSIRPRGAGPSGRVPSSSIATSSTTAGTLRPGSSHNSSPNRFARVSGHCEADAEKGGVQTVRAAFLRARAIPERRAPPKVCSGSDSAAMCASSKRPLQWHKPTLLIRARSSETCQ